MRRIALAAALLAAFSAPAAAQELRTAGLSHAQADSVARIAAVADERWNVADADGLAAVYTADAHNRIAGTPADLRGRDAIRAYFREAFAARRGTFRHRTVLHELQAVAPGVVAADGEVWVDRQGADGAWQPVRRFTMHSVAVRDGGAWRIRVNRVHPDAR